MRAGSGAQRKNEVSNSEKISPTAYATGYMWYRLGLSHQALATPRGRRLDSMLRMLATGPRLIGGVSFDDLMLTRHKGIDNLLTRAIDAGRIGQVIEIAAGLSGRGLRLAGRYGEKILYLETDLPAMVATKRALLETAGLLTAKHRVAELDALADSGVRSLASIASTLDPNVGTAIITEGLMNYLDPPVARALWARIAQNLRRFPYGLYLSDAYLRSENANLFATMFRQLLAGFVGGRTHLHFASIADGLAQMREAGFQHAAIHDPRSLPETSVIAQRRGGRHVRILEASLATEGVLTRG